MKTATLKQARKVLELIEETSVYQLQMLIEGGYLSDLLKANVDQMSRDDFRRLCGLIPKLPVWKTIRLGTGPKTAGDFCKAIKDKGMRIGDYANDILGKPQFTLAAEETEADLVVVSVAELGFKDGAKREDIYAHAQEFGLQRCLSEVGPQLRLQYADQPKGEWLVIGMEPIADSDGSLGLFSVGHDDDGLWLHSNDGDPDGFWGGLRRFVFVLPRK